MALTTLKVERLSEPGRYGDGGGLWLQVSQLDPDKPCTKAWLFRFTLGGKARQMGLGAADAVTLAQARDLRDDARKQVRAGIDPIAARKAAKAQQALAAATAMTFKQAAIATIAAREAGWDNAEHRRQWSKTLETYVYPTVGALPVAAVDTGLVLKCLEPIWTTKRTTAERVRGRIEAVLDWATARGYRSGDNPARWRGHLEHLLSKQAEATKHHPALGYSDLPAFMERLRARPGLTARALEFTILTATRTGESINAKRAEIDGTTWTVPPERMKGTKDKRREHRVPLSTAAATLLNDLHTEGEFLFPGVRVGRALHPKAMNELLASMSVNATVHGFRSTFKDWASECTAYPNEISEMALAHAIPSKVEASYRRGDLFEKRRRLMEDWAQFCGTPVASTTGAVVLPIGLQRGR
jgi:integrase